MDQILSKATLVGAIAVCVLVVVAIFYFILKKILTEMRERILLKTMKGFVVFEVNLPNNNEVEIQAAEQMFSGLLGIGSKLKGLKGFKSPKTFVSFEVVAMKETIRFYVVCPKKIATVVDRQINGTYPMAEITFVKEYNIFPEDGKVSYAALQLGKESRLPIQTHEELPIDTIATITDSFSKLQFYEGALFQVVISPSGSEWRNSAKEYIAKVKESRSDSEKTEIKENDDTISLIDKKASKSGFYADIRLVVASQTQEEADAHITNILSTFDQYTKEGGNRFKKADGKFTKRIVTDVIHRIPREAMILNVEELATVYHFPNQEVKAPYIQWLLSKKAPAPDYVTSHFEEGNLYIGRNKFRGGTKEVFIKPEDRMRHFYVIGQTGAGKSGFISGNMIRDIKMGHGCAFIDPHGSDAEKILQQIPPERVEDVVLFDPSDLERPAGLNMLEFENDAQRTLVINEMLNIFNTLYDLKKTGGPMFEQYFRYSIMLLTEDPDSGSTLMEVPKVFADDDYRKYKLSKTNNQEIIDFWKKQAEKAGGEASLKNITPYVVSKLASFLSNAYVRPIVAQQKSTIDFKDIMNSKKILIAKLSKGRIGEFNMSLLGMIIVGKLLVAALGREDVAEEDREPFYLYIDEFQNFLTDGINIILSEARKYRLSLTLAHQFIGQLVREGNDTKIRDAIFGNVGNKAIFRVGPDDAEFLKKQFDGYFDENDLKQVENGTYFTKMLVDGKPAPPFTLRSWYGESPYDMITTPNPHLADVIRQISRIKYGKDRNLIEHEIKMRSKFIQEVEEEADAAPKFDFGNFSPKF